MILVLNQSPLSTIFAIVQFPGSTKLVLPGNPLYLEIHQPLPENPLASMVNFSIVGSLPITTKGFPIVAKGFPGRD